MFSFNQSFDFYDRTNLKSYNLDEKMRYQLKCLDSLDVFTRKHCENVANLVCRICEYLHCQKSFTEYCTICAYMHDIGKMAIPPSILQKPSRLTDEEFEVMKTHTTIGYKMCINDEKLRAYAAGPYYHHEALDGSGYPQGLTKKDIPYEGQIIRVADEYDAITSKRQYKSHVGISDTLEIIMENTKPREKVSNSAALSEMARNVNLGKDNIVVVKALFKVVLDDINYEIYCTQKYIDGLKQELKRYDQIQKYKQKMEKAKKDKDKQYWLGGMEGMLRNEETLENYEVIFQNYRNTYESKLKDIESLFAEIKKIKRLKI